MADREHRFPLTEPFTATERGRYAPVHTADGWSVEPAADDDWDAVPLEPGATVTAVYVKAERLDITHPAAPDGQLILDLPMRANDAGADTVREYLLTLLGQVWTEQEGFSGKRPFGTSGWECDLFEPLAAAGLITAAYDGDGYLDYASVDRKGARELIDAAIGALA
jgi:hypothetical protein